MAKHTGPSRTRPEDNLHEPLARLLKILSSPWTMLLLHRLHIEGPKRFGELKRRLGAISTKTLTERLRMLEAEGWLTRHYEPTVPPQVTYTLAERVLELDAVMVELDRIAERWYGTTSLPMAKKGKPRS
ncbi:winged helix-turn-helix transcriptional regulator [Anatilimnocola sp. NA78]|uniref:winged helix-turn-helix transcriptional regulator n=1 Tax=Anatilimnocola sp. NA78 TaxID=3415683 RepID=UPI003CE4FE98